MIGGLLLCSGFLYVLDVYATTALDRYLLEHYGPELYERYTSEYDPDGNGFEIPVKRIESGEHGVEEEGHFLAVVVGLSQLD